MPLSPTNSPGCQSRRSPPRQNEIMLNYRPLRNNLIHLLHNSPIGIIRELPIESQRIQLLDALLDDSHGSLFADPVGTVLAALGAHPAGHAGRVAFGVAEIVEVFELLEHGLPGQGGGGLVGVVIVE